MTLKEKVREGKAVQELIELIPDLPRYDVALEAVTQVFLTKEGVVRLVNFENGSLQSRPTWMNGVVHRGYTLTLRGEVLASFVIPN